MFTLSEGVLVRFLPAAGGSSFERQRRELMSREQIEGSRELLHIMDLEKMPKGFRGIQGKSVRKMSEAWNHSARIKGQTAGSTPQNTVNA